MHVAVHAPRDAGPLLPPSAPGCPEESEQVSPRGMFQESYEGRSPGAAGDESDDMLVRPNVLQHYNLAEEILHFFFRCVFCEYSVDYWKGHYINISFDVNVDYTYERKIIYLADAH